MFREIILKMKLRLSQLNVFYIKIVRGAPVILLNYWISCTGSRMYYWTVVYLSGNVRPAHLLSVSPLASHSKILRWMRKGKKRNRMALFNAECRKEKFTYRAKLAVTQEWKILYWDKFVNRWISQFDIFVWHLSSNWHKAVYFDHLACLMALYTDRTNAHLIVATHCTASFSACSKTKDADLGKCGPQQYI